MDTADGLETSSEELEDISNVEELEKEANEEEQKAVVPEKFQGKSVEEIIQSYENLEKELGRKGNELGELRKLTDQIIQQGITTRPSPAPEPEKELTDEDFLEKPIETVTRLIKDAMAPIRTEAADLKKTMTLDRLEKIHPDMRALVGSEEFQKWVLASPVRENLWSHAAEGNFDFANELFTLYKEVHKSTNPTSEEEVKMPSDVDKQKLEDAAAISRGTSREVQTDSKKVYRRADLIRLKVEDPQRYAALQPEILQAYADGRVR